MNELHVYTSRSLIVTPVLRYSGLGGSACRLIFCHKYFISARQHICYSVLYAIARPSVYHTGGSVSGGAE